MPDPKRHEPHDKVQDHPRKGEAFDREIGVRGINRFLIGLILTIVVTGVLMWWLVVHFKSQEVARDPEPPRMVQEDSARRPPEPRLQTTPEEDLQILRAEEEELLHSYGWVDEKAGIARIPIDRSIDLLLQRGLPARAEPRSWEGPAVWHDPSLERVLPQEVSP